VGKSRSRLRQGKARCRGGKRRERLAFTGEQAADQAAGGIGEQIEQRRLDPERRLIVDEPKPDQRRQRGPEHGEAEDRAASETTRAAAAGQPAKDEAHREGGEEKPGELGREIEHRSLLTSPR
jgi:hypothetical protein